VLPACCKVPYLGGPFESAIYGSNVEIVAIIDIYEVSVGIYFVSEGQIPKYRLL
jgi:hypothetical protein